MAHVVTFTKKISILADLEAAYKDKIKQLRVNGMYAFTSFPQQSRCIYTLYVLILF